MNSTNTNTRKPTSTHVAKKTEKNNVHHSSGASNAKALSSPTSTSSKSLSSRKIEKNPKVDPPKLAEPKPVPGIITENFKVRSTGVTKAVEVMPLGSHELKSVLNPNALTPKELLKTKYNEGRTNSQSTEFGYFYTPHTPLSVDDDTPLPKLTFKVIKGYDIAVIITNRNNDDNSISARKALPYTKLALKLDAIVTRMINTPEIYPNQLSARKRVAGDIVRVGSGSEIKGRYTEQEWHDLGEFAMVIRADKARAPGSTRYCIDPWIRDTATSFVDRFGNADQSLYPGAPKGGAKQLKDKQQEFEDMIDPTLTDVDSDKP